MRRLVRSRPSRSRLPPSNSGPTPDLFTPRERCCAAGLFLGLHGTRWRHGVSRVMAEPALRILPWDRPLPTVAVEWLVEGWGGDRVLDLSDTLLIVPTRQAGRRLREALAARAGERKQAVFPPRVVQPERVLDLAAPANARRPASRAAQLVGWIHVLREISMDDWREVFPIDPPDRSFRWALGLAEEFVRLQDALAEGALRMGDVATRAGAGFPERERWEQLGGLERLHDNWLGRADLVSPGALHQVTAREPAP